MNRPEIDIKNRFTPEQRERIIDKAAEALAAPEDQVFFRVTFQMIAEERGDLALCHIIEAAIKREDTKHAAEVAAYLAHLETTAEDLSEF